MKARIGMQASGKPGPSKELLVSLYQVKSKQQDKQYCEDM